MVVWLKRRCVTKSPSLRSLYNVSNNATVILSMPNPSQDDLLPSHQRRAEVPNLDHFLSKAVVLLVQLMRAPMWALVFWLHCFFTLFAFIGLYFPVHKPGDHVLDLVVTTTIFSRKFVVKVERSAELSACILHFVIYRFHDTLAMSSTLSTLRQPTLAPFVPPTIRALTSTPVDTLIPAQDQYYNAHNYPKRSGRRHPKHVRSPFGSWNAITAYAITPIWQIARWRLLQAFQPVVR